MGERPILYKAYYHANSRPSRGGLKAKKEKYLERCSRRRRRKGSSFLRWFYDVVRTHIFSCRGGIRVEVVEGRREDSLNLFLLLLYPHSFFPFPKTEISIARLPTVTVWLVWWCCQSWLLLHPQNQKQTAASSSQFPESVIINDQVSFQSQSCVRTLSLLACQVATVFRDDRKFFLHPGIKIIATREV